MEIKQFLVEMQQFERTLNNAYNEIDSSIVNDLENEIAGLRDSLRDIESTIDDWSNTLDEVRDEFVALQRALQEEVTLAEEPETIEIVRMSDWQMQQKKTFVRNNLGDKQSLVAMLKADPQSFWVTVATCIVEDPFHCSDLADFVVNYEQYIK